jgi:TonB family protein
MIMLTSLFVGTLFLVQGQEPPSPAPIKEEAQQPVAPEARTISGTRIKEPRKTKHSSPEWPEKALRAGLTGTVVLESVIGVDGHVQTVKVVSGFRSLAEAAAVAVRKWQYTPTELDGTPVPVIMTITVNFRLQSPPKRDDLIGMVRDPDPEIRWAAVRWLGRFRPITSKQKKAVESGVGDSNELVRTAAKEARAKLEKP